MLKVICNVVKVYFNNRSWQTLATFQAVHLVCLEIGMVNSPFWKGAPQMMELCHIHIPC